jgi:WD40 repeat protein
MNFLNLDDLSLKDNIDKFELPKLFVNNIDYDKHGQHLESNNNIGFPGKSVKKEMAIDPNCKVINFSKKEDKNKLQINDLQLAENLLFACGGNELKIFELKNDLSYSESITIIFSEDEILYTLAYTSVGDNYYVVAGGKKSVIKVFSLNSYTEVSKLMGHRDEIWDLKFNPAINNLLLSASSDHSIRLWDINNSNMVCIFGGNNSHLAQVFTVNWHNSGNFFVSSGVDMKVLLWKFTKEIDNKIKESRENKQNFKTLIINKPLFSGKEVHNNIIDSVSFYGNLILSKSADGLIKLTCPNFNHQDVNMYMLIKTFVIPVKTLTLYKKMYVDEERRILITGNEIGEVLLFNLDKDAGDDDLNCIVKPEERVKIEGGFIRAVTGCRDTVAVGNVNGDIYLYKLKHKINV